MLIYFPTYHYVFLHPSIFFYVPRLDRGIHVRSELFNQAVKQDVEISLLIKTPAFTLKKVPTKKMTTTSTFKTPAGLLQVTFDQQLIHHALFTDISSITDANSPMAQLIAKQINEYNNNPQYQFDLPLKAQGTAFQQRVWNALRAIPAGQPTTYGELAKQLLSAPRAIGQACKRNPFPLFIPCHRVVGKQSIGGFMGRTDALHYKIALLKHE